MFGHKADILAYPALGVVVALLLVEVFGFDMFGGDIDPPTGCDRALTLMRDMGALPPGVYELPDELSQAMRDCRLDNEFIAGANGVDRLGEPVDGDDLFK